MHHTSSWKLGSSFLLGLLQATLVVLEFFQSGCLDIEHLESPEGLVLSREGNLSLVSFFETTGPMFAGVRPHEEAIDRFESGRCAFGRSSSDYHEIMGT